MTKAETIDSCEEYGRTTAIEPIKRFAVTRITCGVGFDEVAWFVYDKPDAEPWRKHCGPYSTREQAVDWINAIRERP